MGQEDDEKPKWSVSLEASREWAADMKGLLVCRHGTSTDADPNRSDPWAKGAGELGKSVSVHESRHTTKTALVFTPFARRGRSTFRAQLAMSFATPQALDRHARGRADVAESDHLYLACGREIEAA
jgi:hypothetical protein